MNFFLRRTWAVNIMRNEYAEEIKARVRMPDVCDKYGLAVNRAGFAVCPFHTEKTASMKVYKNGFHCFGCGAHGSVIDFVMHRFGLDFGGAVTRLNFDFQLGLPVGRVISAREKKRLIEAERARKRQAEERQRAIHQIDTEYEKLHAQWQILDSIRTRLQPRSPEEPLNPLFVDALHYKEYVEYLLDEKEEERRRMYGR